MLFRSNPDLWNSWRATLLRQLYGETRKALRRGLETPVDRATSVNACKESAHEHLVAAGMRPDVIEQVWRVPGDEFFLRHTPRQVAKVTELINAHDVRGDALVTLLDLKGQGSQEGATEVVLYTTDRVNLFAASVLALSQLDLSICDANIHTSADGLCLNTYVVLTADGRPPPQLFPRVFCAPKVGCIRCIHSCASMPPYIHASVHPCVHVPMR